CMSEVIRDNDLLGVLGLSADKVRVVRPAAPADVPEAADSPLPLGVTRPYLFYPAAFRPYKNHRGLILALRELRDRHGIDDLDLVFTGQGALPGDLRRLAEDCGLPDRIHVLGNVDRAALAGLYRGAFAAVLPSLYEEALFPVAEALRHGCPVACSRIPA